MLRSPSNIAANLEEEAIGRNGLKLHHQCLLLLFILYAL